MLAKIRPERVMKKSGFVKISPNSSTFMNRFTDWLPTMENMITPSAANTAIRPILPMSARGVLSSL